MFSLLEKTPACNGEGVRKKEKTRKDTCKRRRYGMSFRQRTDPTTRAMHSERGSYKVVQIDKLARISCTVLR